jgi:hypothetical protein
MLRVLACGGNVPAKKNGAKRSHTKKKRFYYVFEIKSIENQSS